MKIKFTENNNEQEINFSDLPEKMGEEEAFISYAFKDLMLNNLFLVKNSLRYFRSLNVTNFSIELEIDNKEVYDQLYNFIIPTCNLINLYDNIDYVGTCHKGETEKNTLSIVNTILYNKKGYSYEGYVRDEKRYCISILLPRDGEYIIFFDNNNYHLFKTKDGKPISEYYGGQSVYRITKRIN